MSKSEFENTEVIFLVGAGISVPIGIPAMEGIYQDYMRSGLSDADKRTCKFFNQKMGVEKDLEEFLFVANAIIDLKDSNLNQFIEKSISSRVNTSKVYKYNESLESRIDDVISVRDGILNFLSSKCYQFDRGEAVHINSGFVSALSKCGYSVYSTNYDFAFEHVAIENKVSFNDNFVKTGQRDLWDDEIDFSRTSGFKLIKLHGSVTWYIDEDGTIEKMDTDTTFNRAGKEAKKVVIFPTKFKDIYEQHFFALYSHFLNSLARSKVMVIAGHSLRDEYLRAGIIERKRKGNFQIIVVDPSYPKIIEDELPHSRTGRMGDVIQIPYKWEDFSDELSSIISNNPPKQIAECCFNVVKMRTSSKKKLKIRGYFKALHMLDEIELSIDIQAYLALDERPSKLRVWLVATYTDVDGIKKIRRSPNFIERREVLYGDSLSRLVSKNEKLRIKIPRINSWLTFGAEVSLKVGLVKAGVKLPLNAKGKNLIADDSKSIIYK